MRSDAHVNALSAMAARAEQIEEWTMAALDGKDVPAGLRHALASALLWGSIVHFKGIVKLVKGELFSPACSLLRPQWEAFTHGLWVWKCARDEHLAGLANGQMNFRDSSVEIQALEKLEPYRSRRTLSTLQNDLGKAMHGFTHVGAHQVQRLMSGGVIGQVFSLEEVADILLASSRVALFVMSEKAQLRGDEPVVVESYHQMLAVRGHWHSCFHDLIPVDLRETT